MQIFGEAYICITCMCMITAARFSSQSSISVWGCFLEAPGGSIRSSPWAVTTSSGDPSTSQGEGRDCTDTASVTTLASTPFSRIYISQYFCPFPENLSHGECLIESQPPSCYTSSGASKSTEVECTIAAFSKPPKMCEMTQKYQLLLQIL